MHLIICEKASVARIISAALKANERKGEYFIGNGYIVSWCVGHLLELALPDAYGEQYAKWRLEDLPILPDKWKYVASKDKTGQLKIIKELMNRSDVVAVINACDAGREGELIFRHVYDHANCTKPILRLWIASLEDEAIKTGFANLRDGREYDNLHAAAYSRERADWVVGINATRAFSCLYGQTLNVGRVQSPTLAMLVKRESDIASFVKETFYTPAITCEGFTASGERLNNREAAEAIRSACDGKPAYVQSLERLKKTSAPPKLYDLTTLQREANRLLGFTAQQTLDYAQSLYEKKLLTYPRVDSRYITNDMRDTVSGVIKWAQNELLQSNSTSKNPLKDNAIQFTPDMDRLINDSKVSDHHAIIPTPEAMKANVPALPSGERDILELVTVRLLCATAPTNSYETVTAVLDCGGYSFTARGTMVIDPGWKAIDTAYKASLSQKNRPEKNDTNDDSTLPDLSEGQTFEKVTAVIKEGTNSPPNHYTEDTLLSAMETAGADEMPEDAERRGLGTPATRASIIERLIKAGFVERNKKSLIPTDKGKNLVAVLPDSLVSPKLTAQWEHKLKQIERGEQTAANFSADIAVFVKSIIAENAIPKPEYTGLFISNKPKGESLGQCPRCNAEVREGTKGFFCDTRSCGFKLWKQSKFWTAKKKPLTAAIVTALLKDGRVALKGLTSEKTGKTYDATVMLDDTGGDFVNFKLVF